MDELEEGDNGTPYTDYELAHGGVDDRPVYEPNPEPPETYTW